MEKGVATEIIEGARKPHVVTVHGIQRLVLPVQAKDGGAQFVVDEREVPNPLPEPLELSTLSGFVDYVIGNKDELELAECMAHVVDHCTVELRSRRNGYFAQRATYARASCAPLFGNGFSFGQYVEHESFMVALQALFDQTPDRDDVLQLLAGLKDGEVRTFEDDGVSQAVTAKKGVALVTSRPVPNPVELRPYRTFREIEQSSSLFILRLQSGAEAPLCALYEADGGKWKAEAMASIADYLAEKLAGKIAIIA